MDTVAIYQDYIDPADMESILLYLKCYNLGVNKYRRKVGEGISQTQGIVSRRSLPPDISRITWLHPKLFKRIRDFAAKYVKIPYTSIQINDNFVCAPHKDSHNEGLSYIVAFGDFLDGELCIANGTTGEDIDYNINLRGLLFDGSVHTHWTKPWRGHRYSLVFHTMAPLDRWYGHIPDIDDYEAIEHEGDWKIRRISDGTLIWKKNPLPHPLLGRRYHDT